MASRPFVLALGIVVDLLFYGTGMYLNTSVRPGIEVGLIWIIFPV